MAIYNYSKINTGGQANDGTGDNIRDAFIKVNNNNDLLFTLGNNNPILSDLYSSVTNISSNITLLTAAISSTTSQTYVDNAIASSANTLRAYTNASTATVLATTATAARLGVISVGNGLSIDQNGNLSASVTNPLNSNFYINGRLLAGNQTTYISGSHQFNHTNGSGTASFINWNAGSAYIYFAKAKSNSTGTHAALAAGDTIFNLVFSGSDGTNFTPSTAIYTNVDPAGTVTTSQVPGILELWVADSAGSLQQRLTIDMNGIVFVKNLLRLSSLAAQPANPQVGMIAVADRVNWDPASKGSGNPYPVFYDGAVWNAFY